MKCQTSSAAFFMQKTSMMNAAVAWLTCGLYSNVYSSVGNEGQLRCYSTAPASLSQNGESFAYLLLLTCTIQPTPICPRLRKSDMLMQPSQNSMSAPVQEIERRSAVISRFGFTLWIVAISLPTMIFSLCAGSYVGTPLRPTEKLQRIQKKKLKKKKKKDMQT